MNDISDLRVGIDGFNLGLSRGTGVATYARTLSQALRALGCTIDVLYGMNIHSSTPDDLREVLFVDSLGEENFPKKSKLLRPKWIRETKRHFFGHQAIEITMTGRVKTQDFQEKMPEYDRILNVPSLFRAASGFFKTTGKFLTVTSENPPDIMHWTYPLPIRMKGAKNIYTIHDLVPLTMPHTTLDNKEYHFRLIKKIAEQSTAICTVSEYSKKEILSFFPEVHEKIYNTYQSFMPDDMAIKRSLEVSRNEIKSLFSLNAESYYLFFGSLEPKKNIGRIIESYLSANTNKKLVIVGAMAWKSEKELRFLEMGINSGKIIHLQYLPRTALQSLIRNAFSIIFPSLTEGFGLPVLEALSFGTPVITSREASLPEVGGDACLYVDAYKTEDIAHAMEKLEGNPKLISDLRILSKDQFEKFSMKKYETKLSHMYCSIINKK